MSSELLNVVALAPDDPLREQVVDCLTADYGLDRDFIGVPSMVLAAMTGERMDGFMILSDMRCPDQYTGCMFDIEATHQLLAMAQVGLYRISLIHSFIGTDALVALSTQMVAFAGEQLSNRHSNHVIMIPLMKKANAPAFKLWRDLGFREQSLRSICMSIDLTRTKAETSRSFPEESTIHALDELPNLAIDDLADCYADVFLNANELESARDMIVSLMSAKAFDPALSMVAVDKHTSKLVGFFLVDHVEGTPSANITVVGIRAAHRSHGLVNAGYPLFVQRCLDRGITEATLITSTKTVERLVKSFLKGRITDELVWLIRAS